MCNEQSKSDWARNAEKILSWGVGGERSKPPLPGVLEGSAPLENLEWSERSPGQRCFQTPEKSVKKKKQQATTICLWDYWRTRHVTLPDH